MSIYHRYEIRNNNKNAGDVEKEKQREGEKGQES